MFADLNFCGVTPAQVSRVADRNPHKQGKLLPGTHEIRRQLADIGAWGGKFVTPVPVARVDP